jgi:hypothetical protein
MPAQAGQLGPPPLPLQEARPSHRGVRTYSSCASLETCASSEGA